MCRSVNKPLRTKLLKPARGFSLFEFLCVVVLVAILAAIALSQYQNEIKGSQAAVVSFQANTFIRSIENVRALSIVQKTKQVELEPGLFVYLSRRGWPFATNASGTVNISKPSASGCRSLWFGLFRSSFSENENQSTLGRESFDVSLIDGTICRYKFSRKQEGSFFFDYDVITGKVVITEPANSTEQ